MCERCSYLLELHGVETSIIPLVVAPMVAAVLSMGTITIAVSLIWSPSGTFAAARASITSCLCNHSRLGSQGFTMCDLDRWETRAPAFRSLPRENVHSRGLMSFFGSRLIDGLKGRGEELELLSGRDATTLEKNDWNSILDDGVHTTQPGRQLGVDSLLAVAIHSGHCEMALCLDFERSTRDHTPTEITVFPVLCKCLKVAGGEASSKPAGGCSRWLRTRMAGERL